MKESKELALDTARKAECRLGKREQTLEEEQHAVETLLEEQNRDQCQNVSKAQCPRHNPCPPQDGNPLQFWTLARPFFGDPILQDAFKAIAGHFVEEEQDTSQEYTCCSTRCNATKCTKQTRSINSRVNMLMQLLLASTRKQEQRALHTTTLLQTENDREAWMEWE